MIHTLGHYEWLCKSNFSFLVAPSHPHQLLESAQESNLSSLCLNDFGGLYGSARIHREHQRLNLSLPLHVGAEILIQPDHQKPIWDRRTIVLIAQNLEGHGHLCQIISYSQRQKGEAWISTDELLSFSPKGLACLIPMRGTIRSPQPISELLQIYGPLNEHFKSFYLCFSRHLHPAEDFAIKRQAELKQRLQVKSLLSQDIFFHCPKEKMTCDLLQAIRTNQTIEQAQGLIFPNAERTFHSLSYLERIWSPLPDYKSSLIASQELHQQCHFSMSELSYQYPKEMIPDGHTSQSFLEHITWEGAKKRFGQISDRLITIISKELDLIEELSFADYFLTVWDIVRFARSQKILCQGRGSAANSVVCYCLEITAVNPNHFDLLFERFISKERGDPPDIDVDFEHERREEVIQYIYQRYGRKRAAMVANVITFRRRSAVRSSGKALAIPEEIIQQASELSKTKMYRGQETTTLINKLKSLFPQENISWDLWIFLANQLIGLPRHLGLHSGGFMISNEELDLIVPQEPATMEGRSVIQWSKEDIEGLGLFKIDILALGMLTALKKGFALLKQHHNLDLGLYSIPHEDPATFSMISKANTVGVFQIESRAQMSMLPRLRPQTFYDLVIQVAIIRPGPIQGKIIHPYLKRRAGMIPVDYPCEELRPILARTLGVAIFQEQIMRIAIAVGDFTPGEADELRKNIGVWNTKDFERNLNPWLEKLSRGMESRGLKKNFIEQVMGQMAGFAHYGFPESHAVSFALLAYASSYLKCHYPGIFFCALLNSLPMGFYSEHALIQAAKRDGVCILPPCVQSSENEHTLENIAKNHRPKQLALRLGLRLINNLGQSSAEKIIQFRKENGKWNSLKHFLHSLPLPKNDLAALAKAQAFAPFGIERIEALWEAIAERERPLENQQETSIQWKKESPLFSVQKDFEALGTTLKKHPVLILKESYWNYSHSPQSLILSKDLKTVKPNDHALVFGMIMIKQSPPSANGMVFLTIEDESGFIDVAITPERYALFHSLIDQQSFICLKGLVQKAGEHFSLLMTECFLQVSKSAKIVPMPDSKDPAMQLSLFSPRSYH